MLFQNSWDELRFRQWFHSFDHIETIARLWDHWNWTGWICLQWFLDHPLQAGRCDQRENIREKLVAKSKDIQHLPMALTRLVKLDSSKRARSMKFLEISANLSEPALQHMLPALFFTQNMGRGMVYLYNTNRNHHKKCSRRVKLDVMF